MKTFLKVSRNLINGKSTENTLHVLLDKLKKFKDRSQATFISYST